MNTIQRFIVIDDDLLVNKVSRINIRRAVGDVDIQTFTSAEDALHYLQHEYAQNIEPTILFLDINMPIMSGWEFLEQFDGFSEEIKNQICIYILSSSIDQRDKERAMANKNVTGFFSKPLAPNLILSLAIK